MKRMRDGTVKGNELQMSISTTISTLPMEVAYMIIEEVKESSTLSSCSLVCRAWLHISRKRLFDSITLPLSDRAHSRLEDFIRLLWTASRSSSAVGSYIRDLTLEGDQDSIPRPRGCLQAATITADFTPEPSALIDDAVLNSWKSQSELDLQLTLHSRTGDESSHDQRKQCPRPPNPCDGDLSDSSDWSDSTSSDDTSGSGSSFSGVSEDTSVTSYASANKSSDDHDTEVSDFDTNQQAELGASVVRADNVHVIDNNHLPTDYPRLSLHLLRALLCYLPNLRSLAVCHVTFCDSKNSPISFDPIPQLRSIQNLFIEDCASSTMDFKDYMEVVCLFSSITLLCLDCAECFDLFTSPEPFPPAPLIRSLIIGKINDEESAAALYDSISLSGGLDEHLQSMRFTGFIREDIEDFLDFAKGARGLVDLELDFYLAINESPGLPDSWQSVSLEYFPGLQSLTLIFDIDSDQPSWVYLEVIRTAVRVYAHLLSTHHILRALRTVTFQVFRASAAPTHFRRSAETSLTFPWWSELDAALENLAALECVRFLLCDVPPTHADERRAVEDMEVFLRHYMPKLWKSRRAEVIPETEGMYQYPV
ncbi:hypothetical protein C8Q80DRAFT_1139134 [Daedaleopsis nitida]|nr:hypothetical protein C8Q80DRAFT_1139134 [Daedaleopsis nitida]